MSGPRPAYGAPDGHGRYGILDSSSDGKVLCHECGRWWRHLATHLTGGHGIRADAYRDEHGLPETLPLVGEAVRVAMSVAWQAHRAEHLAVLEAARDPEAANAASRARAGRPWAAATVAGRQARAAARRVDLSQEQLAALGDVTDIPGWCRRVRELIARDGVSAAAISRASGLSTATVSQRLRRYPAGHDESAPLP